MSFREVTLQKFKLHVIAQPACSGGGGGQTEPQVHALHLAYPGSLAVLCASLNKEFTTRRHEERLRSCSVALPSTPFWDGEDVGAQGRQMTQAGDWLCQSEEIGLGLTHIPNRQCCL